MNKINILFFSHAGGNIASYNCFAKAMDELNYTATLIEYPGHGNRISEKFADSLEGIVEDIYERIGSNINDEGYILFGHSMGSWIAYEFYFKMKKHGRKSPMMIIMSGNIPPQSEQKEIYNKHLPDDEFVSTILQLGGTPEEVFNNKELRDLYLPIIRSDYAILEKYRLNKKKHSKINTDIVAIGGKGDSGIYHMLDKWNDYTNKDCQEFYLPGDHFYLFHNVDEIIDIIYSQVQRHLAG